MRYRRADVKGGTYFFTVNLAQRHLRLLLDHVEILREAVKAIMVSSEKLGFASSPHLQAIIRTATLHNTKIIVQKTKVHIS